MTPYDLIVPVRLARCPECRTQTLVAKRGKRVLFRRHTCSGKWVKACKSARKES